MEPADGLVPGHPPPGPGDLLVQSQEGEAVGGVGLVEVESPDRDQAHSARAERLFVDETVIP